MYFIELLFHSTGPFRGLRCKKIQKRSYSKSFVLIIIMTCSNQNVCSYHITLIYFLSMELGEDNQFPHKAKGSGSENLIYLGFFC